jgi:hypothetical protein
MGFFRRPPICPSINNDRRIAMNKWETSPKPDLPPRDVDGNRASNPTQGEAAQRQKRPRAPQFGTDRRGPRDLDARRPASARHHGDPNGLPRHAGTGTPQPERRKSTRDRRQSYS